MLSTALLVAAAMVVGAAQDATSSQLMKEYADAFLGQWTGEIVVDTDLLGVFKKGDKLVATSKSRWALEGTVILADWAADLEGKTVLRAKGIVGVDPKDQKIKLKWFASPGGCGEIIYTREGKKWTSTASSVDLAGVDDKAVGALEVVDANTHVWRNTRRTHGGKALPDETDTWRRKQP